MQSAGKETLLKEYELQHLTRGWTARQKILKAASKEKLSGVER